MPTYYSHEDTYIPLFSPNADVPPTIQSSWIFLETLEPPKRACVSGLSRNDKTIKDDRKQADYASPEAKGIRRLTSNKRQIPCI